jgi:nucleotide-binding universal stress UspA family protein
MAMIRTILVAVDDSAAAFGAAATATQLCVALRAGLVAVGVVPDGDQAERLRAVAGLPDAQTRQAMSATAALRHVQSAAISAGVEVGISRRAGPPAEQVLAEARRCSADLIVIARADRHGMGLPYIGTQAQRILEFAAVPVLVVPPPSRDPPTVTTAAWDTT